jgi:hypothetical protein
LSYTRGTKQLIRKATASDFYEETSVSKANDGKPEKKTNNIDAEKKVKCIGKLLQQIYLLN